MAGIDGPNPKEYRTCRCHGHRQILGPLPPGCHSPVRNRALRLPARKPLPGAPCGGASIQ